MGPGGGCCGLCIQHPGSLRRYVHLRSFSRPTRSLIDRAVTHTVEEEDEEACLPCVYDPTLFSNHQPAPLSPARVRSQSLTQPPRNDYDKVSSSCAMVSTCVLGLFASILARIASSQMSSWLLATCLAAGLGFSASLGARLATVEDTSTDARKLKLLAFQRSQSLQSLARGCGGKVQGSEFWRSCSHPLAWLSRPMPKSVLCPNLA